MTDFRCIPIATETFDALRGATHDTYGNEMRTFTVPASGLPCRHCLGHGAEGDAMLLASYPLPRPTGLYWTPSPIFVHRDACARYERVNHIPDIVRERHVSLRSYDRAHQCIYDLGVVLDGAEAEGPLRKALADPRTAYVNIHTSKPGCLLCSAEKV